MVVSINGWASDYIYQLSATCNDKKNTILGSFGIKRDGLKVESVSCPDGCSGWMMKYGIYIGQISFVGAASTSSQSIGNGLLYLN